MGVDELGVSSPGAAEPTETTSAQGAEWRTEISRKMDAYRSRRRKTARYAGQSQLPFDERERPDETSGTIALAERSGAATGLRGAQEEFSFTIAIGPSAEREKRDPRLCQPIHHEHGGDVDAVEDVAHIVQDAGGHFGHASEAGGAH